MAPVLAVSAALSAAIAATEVLLMAFLGGLVDRLSVADRADWWADNAAMLIGFGALMLVGLPLLGLLSSLVNFQGLLGNFPMRVRWLAHRWLLGQSVGFFAGEMPGRMATRVMQTALSVRESVMKLIEVMLYVSIYFFGALLLIATTADPWLAVPMLVWLAVYVAAMRYFLPRLSQAAERQADARAKMTGRIVDTYGNILTVKLFSHAEREEQHVRNDMWDFLETVHGQMRLITGVQTTLYALNGALLFAVSAASVGLWANQAASVGAITVAVGLALRLHGMSQWIMWEMSALFENLGTVADGIDTLSAPRSVIDRPGAVPLAVRDGRIRFEQVSFHYGKGGGVIDGLDLEVRPGERVGLVGRSGAGKSTLVSLLLRFHDAERGRVLIDGQDVSAVTQDSLRRQIGMVTQDTALLHRSLRDNILYGRPDATESELRRAMEDAEASEFIDGLVDPEGRRGLDAFVGERGVRLSGGQRQRIALARVFLKDAPILVLDEATSALDSEVESAIQRSLERLMGGKTALVIAHRLSTIAHLDRLVVLERGQVIESGSHHELLSHGGLYARLWQRQSGGFLPTEILEEVARAS